MISLEASANRPRNNSGKFIQLIMGFLGIDTRRIPKKKPKRIIRFPFELKRVKIHERKKGKKKEKEPTFPERIDRIRAEQERVRKDHAP